MKDFILQFVNFSSTGETKRHLESLSEESKISWIKSFKELDCKRNTVYLFIWDWIKFQERKDLMYKYFGK